MTQTTTRIVLAARPQGAPTADDFRTDTANLPDLAPGEVLTETLWLSLDPYMRGRMSAAESYAAPVGIGEPMVGGTVSRVLESSSDTLAPGDVVLGYAGWQTHAVEPAARLVKIDPALAPVQQRLGVLGMPGFTAYAGLRNIGKPVAGETVVVAAATGPVGGMVGQLAKRAGARAVGIAGGPEKVAILTGELGFDIGLDHRSPTFKEELAEATPDGIDVYFENVGGAVWDAVLPRLNLYARVPVCGLVANYNATALPEGPDRSSALVGRILTRSLTLRGFIQGEYAPTQTGDFLREVGPLVADGTIRHLEDVTEGLDGAVEAFCGLLVGRNRGKVLVHVTA